MSVYEGQLVATGLKAVLVVSRFNSLVTGQLEAGALDALRGDGCLRPNRDGPGLGDRRR